ncbi:MAG: LysR family transcriptional regulator [Solirubrobacterales bacterium]
MAGPIRTPDIEELRGFCAALELGSLGRAARMFGVSQPALSKRLKALEAIAGTTLLERGARGVTATPAGERLYREARKVLSEVEAVEELMGRLSEAEAPVRLAASHTIAEFVLPDLLAAFEISRPRRRPVELVSANSTTVRALVAEGRAQIGIAAGGAETGAAVRGVERPFCDDEVLVGVPSGHRWAGLEVIPLDEFVSVPLITNDPGASTRRTVEAVLAAGGRSLAPPAAELGSTRAALAAARDQNLPLLASALALQAAGGAFAALRTEGPRFTRQFVVLHSGEGTLPPAARALAEHLQTR